MPNDTPAERGETVDGARARELPQNGDAFCREMFDNWMVRMERTRQVEISGELAGLRAEFEAWTLTGYVPGQERESLAAYVALLDRERVLMGQLELANTDMQDTVRDFVADFVASLPPRATRDGA